MEDIFLRVLDVGFGSSLLIAAVCVLRFFLRSSPAWVMRALWAFVAIRLMLPFYVEVPFETEVTRGTAAFEQLATERISDVMYGEQKVSTVRVNEPTAVESTPTAEEKVSASRISSLVWICGGSAVLFIGVYRYFALKRKVRFTYHISDGVFEGDTVGSSFVFGIFRPRIYLPAGLKEPIRSHVIAHERSHIAHGDHLIKALAYFILSVYWFDPLVWAAFVLLCRDIECCCDLRVVRNMDSTERRAYALSLIKIGTGRAKVARRIITISPIHFGEVGLKGRVRTIMKFSRKIKWTMIVAGVLAIGLATVLFASSFTAPAVTAANNYKNTEKLYMLTSAKRLVSVDVKSGEMNYLCTKADCPHTEDECDLVADEEGFGIYVTDSHVFYARESAGGGEWRFSLWQYDMQTGEAKCVFDENTRINTLSHYGNYLFFNSASEADETEDGYEVTVNKYDLYRYDTVSSEIKKLNRELLDGEQYLDGVCDGEYCFTQFGSTNERYITDANYQNRRTPDDIEKYAPYYSGNEEFRLISHRTGDIWIDGRWTLERMDIRSSEVTEFIPDCGAYRVMGDKVVYLLPLSEPVKIGEYRNERTGENVPIYDNYEDCICIADLSTGEIRRVDYDAEALGGSIVNLSGTSLDDRYFCVIARTLKEDADCVEYDVGGQFVFDILSGEFITVG